MKKVCVLMMLVAVAHVQADYITDFATGAENDFQFAASGQHGADGTGTHNFITWNDGSVSLTSRYNQPVTQFLTTGDNGSGLNDGVFSTSGLQIDMQYNYVSGDTDTAMAEISMAANGLALVNNYPVYYLRVSTNRFELYRHQAYNTVSVLDHADLASTASGSNFEMKLIAEDGTSGAIDFTASLWQNGSEIASFTTSDATPFVAGYAGFGGGGDVRNTGDVNGVLLTSYSVGAITSAIPEPGTLGLMGLTGVLFLCFRRSR